MEILARYVDKEEKIWIELIYIAHVLERICQVASIGPSSAGIITISVEPFLPHNREEMRPRPPLMSLQSQPSPFHSNNPDLGQTLLEPVGDYNLSRTLLLQPGYARPG